jgi:hypothetical protein
MREAVEGGEAVLGDSTATGIGPATNERCSCAVDEGDVPDPNDDDSTSYNEQRMSISGRLDGITEYCYA